MSKKLLVVLILIAIGVLGVAYQYMMPKAENIQPSEVEKSCLSSGGQVVTGMCCISASDFPNSCLIGACGCSPTNSHRVKTCNCGEGKCFDGNSCISI